MAYSLVTRFMILSESGATSWGATMISGTLRYVVSGSIAVLVAANAAFNVIGSVGLLDLSLIYVGGMGTGAAVAGLLYRLAGIRRRRLALGRSGRIPSPTELSDLRKGVPSPERGSP